MFKILSLLSMFSIEWRLSELHRENVEYQYISDKLSLTVHIEHTSWSTITFDLDL